MAIQRQKIRSARRVQSQRRVWFRLSHNEQGHRADVRGQEVLLVQENPSDNQDPQETTTITRGE